ncbi:3-keto-disaccharide hydrolase [Fibrella arboris]|uniref:3-keto-disaccharide hydrolase n=1 Tax=Fibrella arboris TaxID=3242486 RepID=UPI0035201E3E
MIQKTLFLVATMAATFTTVCEAQRKKAVKDGFVQIFDGKTLNGWEGDPTYWRVENGALVGEITPATLLKTNSFIIWKGGEPADFEFTGEFNITAEGNSGINYRSDRLTDVPFALRGYQADIDGKMRYTGQNYEERKRTTLAYRGQKTTIPAYTGAATPEAVRANVKNNAWGGLTVTSSLGSSDSLKTFIKPEDWNRFHLIVKGNHLQHYINGVLMSDVTDEDAVNGMKKGLLGVQVHVGPPMKVQYRNLMLKTL